MVSGKVHAPEGSQAGEQGQQGEEGGATRPHLQQQPQQKQQQQQSLLRLHTRMLWDEVLSRRSNSPRGIFLDIALAPELNIHRADDPVFLVQATRLWQDHFLIPYCFDISRKP